MSNTKKMEAALPGVTLYFRGSREYQVAGRKKAEVKVECDIEDVDTWKVVQKMFMDGFRVYTRDDFKGELLNAFREEMNQLEKKISMLVYESDRKGRELEMVKEELAQKKEILDGFSKHFG